MTDEYIFDDINPNAGVRGFVARMTRPFRSWFRERTSKPCLFFYAHAGADMGSCPDFIQLLRWDDFYEFARECSFPVFRWQYERFSADDSVRFVALMHEKCVLSYGWITTRNRSLTEGHDMEGLPILYDFETPPAYRGNGYYTRLLRILRKKFGGIIYALPTNVPSVKAIRNAGFVQYWPEVKS